ncbi:MAG: orotidine-5'-phosphate decarboxylase [Magnetococcales bacterium]|nr:orotidine-5'-phosphate decarboxylase [Magnetococcales bacterium]
MAKNIPLQERIIYALDVDSHEKAMAWVDRLGSQVHFYKVGLQLFLAGWWKSIDAITERGHKVMCDLKFFDIDATVALAVREASKHNVSFLTVHGPESIVRAAVNARGEATRILAVTVLTSFDRHDLEDLGLPGVPVEELVLSRAKRALQAGCDGVVASGLEAARLRREFGDRFFVVTPGIRPGSFHEEPQDEQKRVATALQAIRSGADHLVVGRPIRDAADPLAMVARLQAEITAALSDPS